MLGPQRFQDYDEESDDQVLEFFADFCLPMIFSDFQISFMNIIMIIIKITEVQKYSSTKEYFK